MTHHPRARVCHDRGVGAIRYLLFAAVAFSLSVYAYRAYRRWIAPERPSTDPGGDDAAAAPSTSSGSSIVTPLPASPPARKVKRGLGFTDPNRLPSASEADAPESLVQQVIRDELAKKNAAASGSPAAPGGAPAAGRSGLFASDRAPAAERVSVAAALTGVRLPDDLVPLVREGTQLDPHHVTFISSTGSAASIGRHLGDELERLGYEVRSETDVVAVATKGAVSLRVTLHPDAGTERVDGVARYPTAAPGSVVVEFES
jgi:hypothetical protein